MNEKLAELEKVKKILEDAYGSDRFVYKKFKIEGDEKNGYKLTFSCDCYFEPIFSMFTFRDYGVLHFEVDPGYSETDRVIISSGNVEVLEKLTLLKKWPQDAKELGKQLELLGCKLIPKEPETGPIIIDEIETRHVVSRKRWNAYWASKGQTGPTSGWEIPTFAQIMAATENFVDSE